MYVVSNNSGVSTIGLVWATVESGPATTGSPRVVAA